MTETWRLTACEIAAGVRRRDLSALEVAQDALARLAAVNPRVNAIVECRPDAVLESARAIDARIAAGEDVGGLAGVPVTTKINTDQAGFATSNGLVSQKDLIAPGDNPAVANLLRAGAVLLGRSNAPAFSFRWFTDNRLFGRTRNPHDPASTPGGSSGGAATAVATGIGALAQGTDVAGSLRYPAFACGVHGLRPTVGRVPNWNPSGPDRRIGAQITLVQGPIARTIGDLGLALAAMAWPDARDPWQVPAPLDGPPAPRRAVVCLRPDGLASDPVVAASLAEAARRLAAQGWDVEEVERFPPLREAAELQTKLWLGDGFDAILASAEREGDAGALAVVRHHESLARSLDRHAYAALFVRRAALAREWGVFLEQVPLVLMPVSAEPPFPDDLDLEGSSALDRVWEAQMTQLAIPALGLPALSLALPGRGRVPCGVQLVAARFREDILLRAGEEIEGAGSPVSPVDPL